MTHAERFGDARELDRDRVIDTDVCVVGAGAAGIVLSVRLAETGHDTLLVEAGGLAPEPCTTELFDATNVGMPYHDVRECRSHRFGGTTWEYGGFCRPVTDRDFAPVPGQPLASWPITHDDIAPWIDEAIALLGFTRADFSVEGRLAGVGLPPAPVRAELAGTDLFAILPAGKRSFPDILGRRLADARRLKVLLNAVATKIRLDPGADHVRGLDVGTASGRPFTVRARRYVLACGAVENARLLLDSDDVSPGGIGHRSGLLGRCLTDHPHLELGRVRFDGNVPRHLVMPAVAPSGFTACLTAPRTATDHAGCFQYFCRLIPQEATTTGGQAISRLASRDGRRSARTVAGAAARAAGDPLNAARSLVHRLGPRREFVLNHRIEQAPNPSSRIVLLDDRDRLGRRRAAIDWRLDDVDARTLEVGQHQALRYLEAVGATRIRPEPTSLEVLSERGSTYWHHMGTTRMSTSPRDGVTDGDCRVHGVDNLFVVGASVFCRGTFSPPAMTITAFALRLAAHLHGAPQARP